MNRTVRRPRAALHDLVLHASPVWRVLHAVLGLQRPLARRSVSLAHIPAHVGHAIVLGAMVKADGTVSEVLRERLERAVEIVETRPDLVILVSGDGRSPTGPEDEVMRSALAARGIDPERILCDPGGLSTYATMRRARDDGIDAAVVVTNDFHAARAVHVAEMAGIEAYAVDDCASRSYADAYRPLRLDERRELVAHLKDWGTSALRRRRRARPRGRVSAWPPST